MILYHSTDEAGKIGIEADGFGLSHLKDSPNASWFSADRDERIASRVGWWVIVELPDDVAAQHLHHFEDGEPYLNNYLIPWTVVNQYRPFRYNPFD